MKATAYASLVSPSPPVRTCAGWCSPPAGPPASSVTSLPARTAALLIDNRSNTQADVAAATAVTALGRAAEVAGEEQDRLQRLPARPPSGPGGFCPGADTALVAVTVERYLLVGQFQQVRVLAATDLG